MAREACFAAAGRDGCWVGCPRWPAVAMAQARVDAEKAADERLRAAREAAHREEYQRHGRARYERRRR